MTTAGLVLGAFSAGRGPVLFDTLLTELSLSSGDGFAGPAWFFNDYLRQAGIPIFWGLTVAIFAVRRQGTLAALFLLAALVGPLNAVLKDFYDRPRPLEDLGLMGYPGDESFPSGHVMTAVAFFGLWAMAAPSVAGERLGWAVRIVAVLAVVLTGYSRVWALAHWPTDVVAGAFFGGAFVGGLWAARAWVSRALGAGHAAFVALEWHLATGISIRHVWEAAPAAVPAQ